MPANNFLDNYKSSIDAILVNAASMRPGDLKSKKIVTYSKPFDIKSKTVEFAIKQEKAQTTEKEIPVDSQESTALKIAKPIQGLSPHINKATKENFVEIYKDDDIPIFEDSRAIEPKTEIIQQKSEDKEVIKKLQEKTLLRPESVVENSEQVGVENVPSQKINNNQEELSNSNELVENLSLLELDNDVDRVESVAENEEITHTDKLQLFFEQKAIEQDSDKLLEYSEDYNIQVQPKDIIIDNNAVHNISQLIPETQVGTNEIKQLSDSFDSSFEENLENSPLFQEIAENEVFLEYDSIEVGNQLEVSIETTYNIVQEARNSIIEEVVPPQIVLENVDTTFSIDTSGAEIEKKETPVVKIENLMAENFMPESEKETNTFISPSPTVNSGAKKEKTIEEKNAVPPLAKVKPSETNTSVQVKNEKIIASSTNIKKEDKPKQTVAKVIPPINKKISPATNKAPAKVLPKKIVKKEANFFVQQTEKVKKAIASITKMVKEIIEEEFNQKSKNKKLSTKYIPQWSEEKIEKPKFSIQKKATIYDDVKTASQQKLNEIIVKKKKLEKIKDLCSWNASSISVLMEAYLLESFQEKKTVSITSNHLKKIGLAGDSEDEYVEPEDMDIDIEYSQREIDEAKEYSYFNPIAARISENRAQMERKEREEKISNYRKSLDIYSDDEASIYQKAIAEFLKDNKEFLNEVNKDEYLNQLEELQED